MRKKKQEIERREVGKRKISIKIQINYEGRREKEEKERITERSQEERKIMKL